MNVLQAKNEMNSICLCITTYNRPQVIRDFFEKCGSYYLEAGIDIYIFDSSNNNDTKHVLDEWEDKNKGKAYYIKMPSAMHANMKVYKIWQFYGLKRKYDFVWMSGDVLQFYEQGIRTIMDNLHTEYDLIELDIYDKGDIGYKLYTQADEFFTENAWKTTYFGTVILNSHTVLANVDWNHYETKYKKKKFINYSHVSFFFNRILELNDFKCMHLPLYNYFTKSVYKKEAGWRKDTFPVLCKGGVSTIKALPSCYTNKKKAILDLGVNSVFYNADAFWKLKNEGIYNFRNFVKYFFTWRKVCNVGYGDLFIMAIPFELEKKLVHWKLAGELRKFGKGFKCLYLYGAGTVGERCGKYLLQNGVDYTGYIVTKDYENKATLNNHPVVEIDKLESSKDMGIIITVSDNLSEEIITKLKEYGYGNQIFYNSELNTWIKRMMME